jgi:hypothetical protein
LEAQMPTGLGAPVDPGMPPGPGGPPGGPEGPGALPPAPPGGAELLARLGTPAGEGGMLGTQVSG